MHEMPVVRDIVAMVCDACRGYRDAHVRQVHLTVGAMHDVETDLVPGFLGSWLKAPRPKTPSCRSR